MSGWLGRATAFLEPLVDLIRRRVRQGTAIFTADTTVKAQQSPRGMRDDIVPDSARENRGGHSVIAVFG